MSLSVYKKKRSFNKTPEPGGEKKSSKGGLRFVVQKHDATQLHYDFRLEMDGVLKSWAVPKGPSLNPEDKRLAMMVEDHPYDYRNFEGIIPEGEYGGGTVMVWDEGTFEPYLEKGLSRKEQEKHFLNQLEKGDLKFILHGEKLKGAYALFNMKGRGERSWLLVKKKDDYATEKDVLLKDKSVKTGKTLVGIARDNGTKVHHPEKKAGAVVETAAKKKTTVSAAKKTAPKKTSKKTRLAKTSGIQLDLDAAKEQLIELDGHELKLTNLNKLYWKKEKFSKGDMINYYLRIAPYMMPYMLDRPQSLNRHPDGIAGPSFYQKNQKGKLPSWMKTHKDFSESTNETVEYLVCTSEAVLIYMANLGCIEMHPWHSRVQSWQYPDWCLIDLDPDTKNTYEQVMDVARLVKQILDTIGADAYVKTSGSSGIHILIPLGARYDFDQSKMLAELVVNLVHQEMPGITSLERSPAKRKNKIYLDYLQNRQIQTMAAAYSLRPKPGMPVSTPLDWSELKKGLKPTDFNALNIFDRLKVEGDLFSPVLGKGINLEKVLKKLEALLK